MPAECSDYSKEKRLLPKVFQDAVIRFMEASVDERTEKDSAGFVDSKENK